MLTALEVRASGCAIEMGVAMMKRAKVGFLRGIVLAVVLGATLVCAPRVHAQGPDWGQMYDPPVNSREVEQIAKTLGVDASQQELLDDLHGALLAEFERLSGIMRQMMQDAQTEARETGRTDVWIEIGKKAEQFAEKKKEMQKQFFEDIKLVLNEEQLVKWPAAERRWYRGQMMGNRQLAFLSGLRADVVVLVEEMQLTAEQAEAVAPVLDQYDREVDRELHAFEKLAEEQKAEWDKLREKGFFSDMEKFNELFGDLRDQLVKVRDLNGKYRDQLALRLEGESKEKFSRAYDKAAFPAVYKDSYVDAGIRTALEMADLTTEQRAEVVALQERFGAEVFALNKKIEKSILDADEVVSIQALMSGGAKSEEKSALESQKKDLMSERFAQLRALLTEEQATKLPSAEGDDWRNTQLDF